MIDDSWAVPIIVAFLTGGGVKFVVDFIRERKVEVMNRPTLAQRTAAEIDANILTVARARDELEADNARLREQMATERQDRAAERVTWQRERERHHLEREAWQREREAYQAEIDRLLVRVRQEREAANERYDALLRELFQLKTLHSDGGR